MRRDYEIVTSGGVYYPGRRIETKKRMYELLRSSQLGNAWPDCSGHQFNEQWASKFFGGDLTKPGWAIRTSHKDGGGGPFLWALTFDEARSKVQQLAGLGYVCSVSPTDDALEAKRVGQGYFCRIRDRRGWSGLYFHEASASGAMRAGFESASLEYHCTDAYFRLSKILEEDYDWVVGLIDKFEGAVVEFTTYDKPLGTENKRTVIWEVRHY